MEENWGTLRVVDFAYAVVKDVLRSGYCVELIMLLGELIANITQKLLTAIEL